MLNINLKQRLTKTKTKFFDALPVILFFLFLFYTMYILFGSQAMLIVSTVTTLFKINYRKAFTLRSFGFLLLSQCLLAFAAFLAALNLPLCILLNLTVPFVLVFLQTSQFQPMGYFAGAMCFTFLQLRPVGWNGFFTYAASFGYGLLIFTAALALYGLRHKKSEHYTSARKGLMLLSHALRLASEGKNTQEMSQDVFAIQQQLYREAYQSRGITYMVTGAGRIKYLFAIMFQRAVYFLSDMRLCACLALPENKAFLAELSDYLERLSSADLAENGLLAQGKILFERTEICGDDTRFFAQNLLRPLNMLLEELHSLPENKLDSGWRPPRSREPLRRIFSNFRLDAFEFRFACRLSLILTCTFAYSMVFHAEHGYWLALNAFILLRPMYEDSAYRVKTRFLGTAAGCLLLHLLLPLFHGTPGHFLLASLMVIGMYTETPGTVIHAVYVTCFALTMTTLALPQETAMELRMLYVVLAILLVLAVNRFFFPISMKSQFRYNLQLLFHQQHVYLRMIDRALRSAPDYGEICGAQIHCHMIYGQLLNHLKQETKERVEAVRELLLIQWRLVSVAEQILFFVIQEKDSGAFREPLHEYLVFTDYILNDISKKLHMDAEVTELDELPVRFCRSLDGFPRLSALMDAYAHQVSCLYRAVCRFPRETARFFKIG